MGEIFITKVIIKEVRHLKDLEIPLSDTNRKHLILTGRNGSGKTSVLEAVAINLIQLNGAAVHTDKFGKDIYGSVQKKGCELVFSAGSIKTANDFHKTLRIDPDEHLITTYFRARRTPEFRVPNGTQAIQEPDLVSARSDGTPRGKEFLQHLVNIYTDRAILREEGKDKDADLRKEWLSRFEGLLKSILNSPEATLKYEVEAKIFKIIEPGKIPYSLNELSDGYGAVVDVISEIIMRMPMFGLTGFDAQGIVLIDEIETHLHIDLQKEILHFLTQLFPRIQFIVTTHSPFVLSSVKNAVICDLEKRIVTEDLSAYSSELIVESYFDQDKYSEILKEQITEFEHLMGLENPTLEQEDRMLELERYLESAPKYLSNELASKLYEIQLKYIKPAH